MKIIGELPVFSIFDKAKIKEEDEILNVATRLGSSLAESLQS